VLTVGGKPHLLARYFSRFRLEKEEISRLSQLSRRLARLLYKI
jgi:hypothetical protein